MMRRTLYVREIWQYSIADDVIVAQLDVLFGGRQFHVAVECASPIAFAGDELAALGKLVNLWAEHRYPRSTRLPTVDGGAGCRTLTVCLGGFGQIASIKTTA
jgi:hypothetical protein